jgi:DNA-binding CsgD family transcriptional regulator
MDYQPYDFGALSSVYRSDTGETYLAEHTHHERGQWEYLSRQPPLKVVYDDHAGVARAELDARSDYVYTIVDPDAVPAADVRRLAVLNGLTKAETEVCALLVEGASRSEIAGRRDTTAEAAKAQTATILAKTGERGRGDLIRRLLQTVPPVT